MCSLGTWKGRAETRLLRIFKSLARAGTILLLAGRALAQAAEGDATYLERFIPQDTLSVAQAGAFSQVESVDRERGSAVAAFKSVQFGATIYRIPEIFLPGVTPFNKDKNYAAFTIGILLPEFKPAGTDLEEFRRTGWHNQLRVLFEYGLHFRDEMDIVDETLKWYKIDKEDYAISGNGCKLYKGEMAVSNELYVCARKTYVLKITCETRHVVFPSCTVIENVGENTTVIYHYSRQYIDQAVWIDDKLRELAKSFAVTR